jgi:hypothetical protein
MVKDGDNIYGEVGHTPFAKISPTSGNGPPVTSSAFFGSSVANLGDLDGDGNEDLAVGASGEDAATGGVYILFMNANLTVRTYVRLGDNESYGVKLVEGSLFGYSLANIGDLDGDNVTDIVVGVPGSNPSFALLFFLTRSGYPKQDAVMIGGKFTSSTPPLNQNTTGPWAYNATLKYRPNGPPVFYDSYFGSMLAPLGDFNGDGVLDLAVSQADKSGGNSRTYFLYLYRNGTVKYWSTLTSGYKGAPYFDHTFVSFGSSLSVIGDLDNDGVNDIAIGVKGDDDNLASQCGAAYVCFMKSDGSIKGYARLSQLQTKGQRWPSQVSGVPTFVMKRFNICDNVCLCSHSISAVHPWL